MSSDDIGTIDILETRDHIDRSKTSNRIQSTRSRSEEVSQHPIVRCETVHEPTSDDRTDIEPGRLRCSDSCTKDENVLNQTERFITGQFDQGVEDGSCTKRETDKRYGPNTCVTLLDDIGQNETRGT